MNQRMKLSAADIVIFGGTGDLAFRKLLPALFRRMSAGQLPPESRIIAVSRAGLDDLGYRDKVAGVLPEFVPDASGEELTNFLARLEHVSLDIDHLPGWEQLAERFVKANPVRVFYLAVGPTLFGSICANLRVMNLVTAQSRVVLEKPIGTDLDSARAVNDAVQLVFDESQIFRIDHYLGKESVQNLLVTRFANSVFEPLWNARAIDHVQITVSEALGVGTRGDYYDRAGAVRDMVQNHLLQLLCLVAMEPPSSVAGEAVRDEKLKVLTSLKPITAADVPERVVLGQYRRGDVGGVELPGYLDELERGESDTETFVALKAEVSNWRWAGVPFYLRTGKRMRSRYSEIVIAFRPVPHPMFPDSETPEPNRLVLRLQPDESTHLHLVAKEPGPGGIRIRPVSLDLNFSQAFGAEAPEAYERLLMDVVRGNPTLFMRRDEIEAAWRWVEPIIRAGEELAPEGYPAGEDGPAAAARLIGRDGREWNVA